MSSHLEQEIATQPMDWRRVAGRAADFAGVLPRPGERVATIGCGTSWFMGQAYAGLRESSGHGLTDAWAASEHRLARGYDRVVVITRSGTTTEVIAVVNHLVATGTPFVALVATAGTPVAQAAQSVGALILLDDVDEESVVQTRFATSALALLRSGLGEDLAPIAEQAEAVLGETDETCLGEVADAEQVTFLGSGWSIGIANECALKLRESAQFWTESYPAMDYRHGPVSIAAPGRTTWALGTVPDGLADEVRATGAHFENRDLDPMVDLVRVHRLCLIKAAKAGVDPDRPRHLSRSIVLT